MVQFDDVGFGAHFAQEGLGGFAVGAVGFGEDGCDIPPSVNSHRRDTYFEVCSCAWESLRTDCVVVDDVLRFGLGGHDGVGAGCAGTGEDGAYEINGGRRVGGWVDGRVEG